MCALRTCTLLAGLAGTVLATAQGRELPDSTDGRRFAVVLYAGGGLSWFPAPAGVPQHLDTRVQRLGGSGTIRIMWLPDHRLRVGIESGRIPIYSYDIKGPGATGRVEQSAVPIMLVWSMPLTERFSVFAGFGTYHLTSKLDYLGETRSSTFSLGYCASLSYVLPLSPTVGIGLEGKWYDAAETRHTMVAAQVELVWKLYQW